MTLPSLEGHRLADELLAAFEDAVCGLTDVFRGDARQFFVAHRKGDRQYRGEPSAGPVDRGFVLPETKIQDQYDLTSF